MENTLRRTCRSSLRKCLSESRSGKVAHNVHMQTSSYGGIVEELLYFVEIYMCWLTRNQTVCNGSIENQRLKLTVAPCAYYILIPYGFNWRHSAHHQPHMLPMIWLSAVREHVCSEYISHQPSVRVDRYHE